MSGTMDQEEEETSLPPPPPELRGIFGPSGDSPTWTAATMSFPNGCPRFSTKDEALAFMEDYNTSNGGSNPDHPHLMHIFTMLIDWNQIETILLPEIEKARKEPSSAEATGREYLVDLEEHDDDEVLSENVFENPAAGRVTRDLEERLDLPLHRCLTPASVENTLRYLFFHMKCGIYVMIRDGKLRIFSPFVNRDYRNTWGHVIKMEGNDDLWTYYREKMRFYRKEHVEEDRYKWWANGNIICNEMCKPQDKDRMQYWGDHFLAPLRDMLGEAARTRKLPDCEFFIK